MQTVETQNGRIVPIYIDTYARTNLGTFIRAGENQEL